MPKPLLRIVTLPLLLSLTTNPLAAASALPNQGQVAAPAYAKNIFARQAVVEPLEVFGRKPTKTSTARLYRTVAGVPGIYAVIGDETLFLPSVSGGNLEDESATPPEDQSSSREADKQAILRIIEEEGVHLPVRRPPLWMRNNAAFIRHGKEGTDKPLHVQIRTLYEELTGPALAAGTELPDYEAWYQDLLRIVGDDRQVTDEIWFKAHVIALDQIEAFRRGQEPPASYADALRPERGWKLKLTYYPSFSGTRCAFNHKIEWAYHVLNEAAGRRIVLGPDEIVNFGVLSGGDKKQWRDKFLEANRQMNARTPQLSVCLSLLREPALLDALLKRPEFSRERPRERAQLLGFAQLALGLRTPVSLPIIGQTVLYQEGDTPRKTNLTVETVDRILNEAREMVDKGRIELRYRRTIPTRLQILAMRIAQAQSGARAGDFTGWDSLATLYSRYVEQLGTFFVRLVLLGRFAGLLASAWRPNGKSAAEILRIGSVGSGPAILARAFHRILKPLAEKGLYFSAIEFVSVDASKLSLQHGEKIVYKWRQAPRSITSLKARIGEREAIAGIASSSLDVAESGLMDSLSADEKINFLIEMNRILDEKEGGGYLLLSGKQPLSAELRGKLPEFGFAVLTEPNARLYFSLQTRHHLAGGKVGMIGRLHDRLASGSYLVAVKTRTLEEPQIHALRENSEIRDALANAEKPAAMEEGIGEPRRQPQEIAMNSLDFSQIDMLPTGIFRMEMADPRSAYTRFEESLSCLYWGSDYLTTRENIRLQSIIDLWTNPAEHIFPRREVEWVLARVNKLPRPSEIRTPSATAAPSSHPSPDAMAAPPAPSSLGKDTPGLTLWKLYKGEEERLGASLLDQFRGELGMAPSPMQLEQAMRESITGDAVTAETPDIASPATESVPTAPGMNIVIEVQAPPKANLVVELPSDPVDRTLYLMEIIIRESGKPVIKKRMTQAFIDEIVYTLNRIPTEEKRIQHLQEVLDEAPAIRGISARQLYDILRRDDIHLVDPPKTELEEGPLPRAPLAPIVIDPKITPTSPRVLPIQEVKPVVSPQKVLLELAKFVQTCFNDKTVDLSAWLRQESLLRDAGIAVSEAVSKKSAWASQAVQRDQEDLFRYIVLFDWLETLNYLLVTPFDFIIYAQASSDFTSWTIHLLPIKTARGDSYVLHLPQEKVQIGHFHTASRLDAHLTEGLYSHTATGILTWGNLESFTKNLVRQLLKKSDALLARPGDLRSDEPEVQRWMERYHRIGPLAILEKKYVLWGRATWIAIAQQWKRLIFAVSPNAKRTSSGYYAAADLKLPEASFLDAYLDPHGFLAHTLRELPEKLKPSASQLVDDVYIELLQMAEGPYPARGLLRAVQSGLSKIPGYSKSSPCEIITAYLLAAYLRPTDAWDTQEWNLEKMLRAERANPDMIRHMSPRFLEQSDDYIRSVARDILEENFRARLKYQTVGRGKTRRLVMELMTSSSASNDILNTSLSRKIGLEIAHIIAKGRPRQEEWKSILETFDRMGIPTGPIQRCLHALESMQLNPTFREQQVLLHLIRNLNDLYFGKRGMLLSLKNLDDHPELDWVTGVTRETSFAVQGALRGEISVYRTPRSNYSQAPVDTVAGGIELGILYTPIPLDVETVKANKRSHASLAKQVQKATMQEDPVPWENINWLYHWRVRSEPAVLTEQTDAQNNLYFPLAMHAIEEWSYNYPFLRDSSLLQNIKEENARLFLFAYLNAILNSSTPSYEMAGLFKNMHEIIANHHQPQPLPTGFGLLIYCLLQERTALLEPSLRTIPLSKFLSTPMADRLWMDISSEMLYTRDEELKDLAERALERYFTVRMRINLKEHTVNVETLPSPALTKSLKSQIGDAIKKAFSQKYISIQEFDQVLISLERLGTPVEPLHEMISRLEKSESDLSEDNALFEFLRLLNDRYLGPRGSVLYVNNTPEGMLASWIDDLIMEKPWSIDGTYTAEIPVYRALSESNEAGAKGNVAFGLYYLPLEIPKTAPTPSTTVSEKLEEAQRRGTDVILFNGWSQRQSYVAAQLKEEKHGDQRAQMQLYDELVAAIAYAWPSTVDFTYVKQEAFDALFRSDLRQMTSQDEMTAAARALSPESIPLYIFLNTILNDPWTPDRIVVDFFALLEFRWLSNQTVKVPEGMASLIYVLLREHNALLDPSIRSVTLSQILNTPTTSELWTPRISREILAMSPNEIKNAVGAILERDYNARFQIDVKKRHARIEDLARRAA